MVGSYFLQSCEHDNSIDQSVLDQQAYDNADVVNGARLYDKFWETPSYTDPNDNSINESDIEDFPNFYRCKQCHGWDLKARVGAYVNRAPKTDRPNVSPADLWEPRLNDSNREIFDAIVQETGGGAVDPTRTADGTNEALGGDLMPEYGKILTKDQIWDLVKFIKEGAMDTEQFYDLAIAGAYPTASRFISNIGKDGDATAGDTYYSNECASCHGVDGKTILLEDGTETLGQFARNSPYEFQHKAKWGNPDGAVSGMTGSNDATVDDIKNLLKAMTDQQKYPDFGVASGPISFASNLQPFFTASCVSCHGGTSPAAGLRLENGVAYDNLINGGYIDLANPTNSLLYQKLNGSMSQYVTSSEKQMVLTWIQQGALNN